MNNITVKNDNGHLLIKTTDLNNLTALQETSIKLSSLDGYSAHQAGKTETGQVIVTLTFIVNGSPLPMQLPKDTALDILEIIKVNRSESKTV